MALASQNVVAPSGLSLSPDLAFLMNGKGIESAVQQKVLGLGVASVNHFALLADDRAGLRKFLKDFLGDVDDPNATTEGRLVRRMSHVKFIDVWKTCKVRSEERRKVEAEQRASKLPLELEGNELVSIRKGFEQKQGRVSDKEWPDEPLVEKRLQEVEQGVLHAEPSEEVASKAECKDEEDYPVADRQGIIRLRRKVVKVPAPRNSEEVRRRIRLLAATFEIVKMRNPNKAFLQDLTADTWEQHVRYFLGEKVANFRFPTQLGVRRDQAGAPTWPKLKVRKEAVSMVTYDGITLAAGLEKARKDTEIREAHFTTPTMADALSSILSKSSGFSSSSSGPGAGWGSSPHPDSKGKGKGKTKGKSKGKEGKGLPPGIVPHNATPDGRKICWAFNSPHERCRAPQCNFVHAWSVCFDTSHPAHSCPKVRKALQNSDNPDSRGDGKQAH